MSPPRFDRPIPGWILPLLALLVWGGEYVRRDLWAPDEARYALVAREAREGGHALVLHRHGEPYAHKPPLFFWLLNAAVASGAPERIAARVPSFLGALMALWAITRLAARWHGPEASWWVALLLPSSFLFWNKGGFGQIDMLLCGLELMGLYFLFTARSARPAGSVPGGIAGTGPFIAAYACFGLALLAKGPVGLVTPLAVYAASSWAAGERARLRARHWLWGPPLALLFPGAWLLAAWWSGAPSEYLGELLFKQNVGRAAGAFDHLQPWHYFLLYFPLDFLPWTVLLPVAWRALGRDAETRRGRARLLAWIVCVIALFSLSRSKRNLYILPAHPAAALLVAASIPAWAAVPAPWLSAARVAMGLLSGVLAAGLLAVPFIPEVGPPFWTTALPAAALLAGAWWTIRARPSFPPRALAGLALAMLAAFASIGALVAPAFNDAKTPDEIVPVADDILEAGEHIVFYRMQGEIISLYARRPGRMADNGVELRELLDAQPRNLVVADPARLPEIEAAIGPDHASGRFSYGGKERVWIAVHRPGAR